MAWLASGIMTWGIVGKSDAQVPPNRSSAAKTSSSHAKRTSSNVYEDDEVKIRIPAGWTFATGEHPSVAGGNGLVRPYKLGGYLLLSKGGYTLDLEYDTHPASGIVGHRFIEMLQIPWLDIDEAWACSSSIYSYNNIYPQPASRTLMFMNITFSSGGDPNILETCGIPKDSARWIDKAGMKELVGGQRWFAGYFTTADRGWFFESDGTNCGEKAYTLTTAAKTPYELPVVDDPDLKNAIREAIGIVNSIHYKRCRPKPF